MAKIYLSWPSLLYTGDGLTCQRLVLGTCFYEHPYCTHSDSVSLMTNVLIVSRFG